DWTGAHDSMDFGTGYRSTSLIHDRPLHPSTAGQLNGRILDVTLGVDSRELFVGRRLHVAFRGLVDADCYFSGLDVRRISTLGIRGYAGRVVQLICAFIEVVDPELQSLDGFAVHRVYHL